MLRIRTCDSQSDSYREVVRFDKEGLFLGLERHYGATSNRIGRCWITADRTVATRWCSAGGAAEATRELREIVAREHRAYVSVEADGSPDDGGEQDAIARWFERALLASSRLSLVFDQAYQFAPGVWVHESSSVHPSDKRLHPSANHLNAS